MSAAGARPEPEAARTASSLAVSALVRSGVLALACAAHDAAAGEFCWPGARGLCRERLQRSFHPAPRAPAAMHPGELEQLAEATRRARRDARLRTRGRTNR